MAYINNLGPTGTIMDAREWDRIADLLMQIRKKYDNLKPKDHIDPSIKPMMLNSIDQLLTWNDKLAEWDGKGWL
jgi:DNA-binding transcriptional regulator GbsR (MarR family)